MKYCKNMSHTLCCIYHVFFFFYFATCNLIRPKINRFSACISTKLIWYGFQYKIYLRKFLDVLSNLIPQKMPKIWFTSF